MLGSAELGDGSVPRRTQGAYYFLSVFLVAMSIAELFHYVFPFFEDGTFHYVSEMYLAALPFIPEEFEYFVKLVIWND